MKPVTFHLTEDQHASLKALSKETGLAVAELIRRFIDLGLERERGRTPRRPKKGGN